MPRLFTGFNTLLVCLLSCLFIVFSCRKDYQANSNSHSPSISVSSARVWFENNSEKVRVLGARGGRFSALKPNWDAAREGATKKGIKFIEIPLTSEQKETVLYKVPSSVRSSDSLAIEVAKYYQLVIYADGKGQYHESIKDLVPSTEYVAKTGGSIRPDDFTGYLFIRNWSNEIIGGYSYVNGKISETISSNSNRGRTNNLVCKDRSVCYWYASCSAFTVHGIMTETSSTTCPYPSTPSPAGCNPWQLNFRDRFSACYIEDPTIDPWPETGNGPGLPSDPSTWPDPTLDPCWHVNFMATNTGWKANWQDLKSKINLNYEAGYLIANGNYSPIAGTPGSGGIDFQLTFPIDGMIHSHYEGILMNDVFTAEDMLAVADIYKSGKMISPGKFYFGVVTPTTQYIMRIADVQKFHAWAHYITSNRDAYIEGYTYSPFDINFMFKGAVNRQKLANYLKKSESGIRLLEGTSDFSHWQGVSTDSNGEVVVYPCN